MLALYRVIYTIPAYVGQVKEYFLQVVYAITGAANAGALQEGAAAKLVQFATDNNIPLTGMTTIGDLTGVTGEALANKMVDILYKLWFLGAEYCMADSDSGRPDSVVKLQADDVCSVSAQAG